MIAKLFGVLCTADHARSAPFYEQLFGRPADRNPMPSLLEWDAGGGALQLFVDAKRAGHGFLTLIVDDYDRAKADVESRGLTPINESRGDGPNTFQVEDPEGNVVTFAQVPPGYGG